MSSIWSSGSTQTSASPFSTNGLAPNPGGSAANKFQSLLQSAGQSGSSAAGLSGQSGLGSNASASQLGTSPSAASAATGTQDNSSTSSATISANDFLSLLVTEMQNQDPTAQTDPNSYINQLVQINSLEQLISINQNLTTALTPTTPASGNVPSSGGGISAVSPSISGSAVSTAGPAAAAETSTAHGVSERATLRNGTSNPIHGSLSVPSISSSSRSVAKSLDGHPRSTPRGHGIRDIPTRALP